ncbi:MAG: hypothetical protein AAGJ35_13870, partial [Myxococcota bacterium]
MTSPASFCAQLYHNGSESELAIFCFRLIDTLEAILAKGVVSQGLLRALTTAELNHTTDGMRVIQSRQQTTTDAFRNHMERFHFALTTFVHRRSVCSRFEVSFDDTAAALWAS